MIPPVIVLITVIQLCTAVELITVVWGKPSSFADCIPKSDLSWQLCIKNCTGQVTVPLCAFVALDPSGTCYLCPFDTVTQVAQTSKEGGYKIGFRIQVDSQPEDCPSGENPPTFNDEQAWGAINSCGGGVLAVITSQWEMDILVYQAGKVFATVNKYLYIRMDRKRTDSCQTTPTTEECMEVQGFTLLDKEVTSFQFYNWITDSSAGATTGKQCIVIVFDGSNNGKQDIAECGESTTLPVYAFLCGHEAFV